MSYTNGSEIVSLDELSKLTNVAVFGLEKRITKPPISQTKADLWEILKALAPLDCPSMLADIKNLHKKLQGNTNLKQKSIIKIQRTDIPRVLFCYYILYENINNFWQILVRFLPHSLQLLVL